MEMEVHHLQPRHMNYGGHPILDGMYDDHKLDVGLVMGQDHQHASPRATPLKTETTSPSTSSPMPIGAYSEPFESKPMLILPNPSLLNPVTHLNSVPSSVSPPNQPKSRTTDRKRPYPCTMCSSRFGSKMELEEHQNSHTGQKPFECDVCQSRFNRRSTLWNHKRIHSDAKPFCCTVCHMTFKWKNSLKCHKEMHMRKNETTASMDNDIKMLTYATAAKKKLAEQNGGAFTSPLQTTTNPNSKRRAGRRANAKKSNSIEPVQDNTLNTTTELSMSADLLGQIDQGLYNNLPNAMGGQSLDFPGIHPNNLLMQAICNQQRPDEQHFVNPMAHQAQQQQHSLAQHVVHQQLHQDHQNGQGHQAQQGQGHASALFSQLDGQFLSEQAQRLPTFLNTVMDFQQHLGLSDNGQAQLQQNGYMNAVAVATSNGQGLVDQIPAHLQQSQAVNHQLDEVLNVGEQYSHQIDPAILLNQSQAQATVDYVQGGDFMLNPPMYSSFPGYHLDQSSNLLHPGQASVEEQYSQDHFQKLAKMLPADRW